MGKPEEEALIKALAEQKKKQEKILKAQDARRSDAEALQNQADARKQADAKKRADAAADTKKLQEGYEQARAAGYGVAAALYVAESQRLREACDTDLKAYVSATSKYQSAVEKYTSSQKVSATEKGALMDLAHLAMKKQSFWARKGEVLYEAAMADSDLREINKWIFWTQLAIFAGKAAELGLSCLAMAKSIKAAVAEAEAAKTTLEKVGDAKKALEKVEEAKKAAEKVEEAKKGVELAKSIGDLLAKLKSDGEAMEKTSEEITKLEIKPGDPNLKSKILELLKKLLSLLEVIVKGIELIVKEGAKFSDKLSNPKFGKATDAVKGSLTGMDQILAAIGILKDLLETALAAIATGKAWKAWGDSEKSQSANEARAAGTVGDPNAKANVSGGLTDDQLKALLGKANDYSSARALADASLMRVKELQDGLAAARKLMEVDALEAQKLWIAVQSRAALVDDEDDILKLREVEFDAASKKGAKAEQKGATDAKAKIGAERKAIQTLLDKVRSSLDPK